jgi:hypothetical protein
MARANAEVVVLAWVACLMLRRTREIVKAVVGRPKHERIASGLKR